VRMDACRAIDHFARLVVFVKVLTHEVDVLCKGLSWDHVVQHGHGACERAIIQTFAQYVPSGSGAVRASRGDAFECLLSALVL
jgi:hypothetical protein